MPGQDGALAAQAPDAAKQTHPREGEIRRQLQALAEPKYQRFAASLIPGCDNLIGVRIPLIRKMAKQLAREDGLDFVRHATDCYFEETMLHGLIIAHLPVDIDTRLALVAQFVPKINNWSVCDSFCTALKTPEAHKEQVFDFLQPYFGSPQTYDVRFGVVMLLFHFIEEGYLEKLFAIFENVTHEDYYVKMAVALAVSICFVHYPQETEAFLHKKTLDTDTHNKALRKICESLRVDADTKGRIKQMRR